MSSIIQSRGEAGGGVAAHLRCPHCGHFSKSHAHQLSHMAASHPASLDGVTVGRLGNILMYQSSGRLFHCSQCFYTSRDFTKLYQHIITKHCLDEREGGGGGEKRGQEEKVALKSKVSIKTEEEERSEAGRPEDEEQRSLLMLADADYRCLICSWKHRQKSVIFSHMVRKHDLPKAYAAQAIRREAGGGGGEDEDGAGLSDDMLKEEVEATAKVVGFVSNRFVCLVCGWKAKLKGFVISHVVRSHDVERPYGCKECGRSFFLPSRLQRHVRMAHRPGRYACPFCYFRSEYLGGFRRHCSRCNAREGDGGEGGAGGVGGAAAGAAGEEEDDGDDEEPEERKETRGARKRRSSGRLMEGEDLEEEDEDD